ncbi:hypothetical protein FRB90_000758 [Tulasnella sp. 427]|nr:hypothetical protein FRB90_000758 [Tulasnella sp. 427]
MLISTDKNNVYDYFRRYHNNVHILIQGEDSDTKCADDPRCIYVDASSSASSLVPPPNGTHLNLPIWKLFHATWWNPIAGAGPLHAAFTLSPEPYGQYGGSKTYYLGYSVEPTCLNIPFVTWSERPRQAYIMGKELRYFLDPKYPLTDSVGGIPAQMRDDFYRVFSEEEDSTFLAGQFDLSGAEGYAEPPPGIVQHARMERTEFQKLISKSRVMMGTGNPVLSPTPYEALCLGIPFINPIFGWNKADPANRNFWDGQHPALIVEGVDEPYVYHVKVGDRVGLKAALKKAMNTTIDRFVPPRMTVKAVLERTKTLLETDWRSIAKQQMLAMHSDGQKIEPDKYIDSS